MKQSQKDRDSSVEGDENQVSPKYCQCRVPSVTPEMTSTKGHNCSSEQKQIQAWAEKYGKKTHGSIPGTELEAPYIFGE